MGSDRKVEGGEEALAGKLSEKLRFFSSISKNAASVRAGLLLAGVGHAKINSLDFQANARLEAPRALNYLPKF
jgi:hypothetical protein